MSVTRAEFSDRVKRAVRRSVRRFGIDIVQYTPLKRRSTLAEAFEQMRLVGIRPATVIDVGVARGTPELYAAFPESRFLLVDPLREWEAGITELAASMGAVYERVAASRSPGTAHIHVPDSPSHATFYAKDDSGEDRDWIGYEVETARLDDLIARNEMPAPYLVKVDVEGAELEVLCGASDVLRETMSVTVEVTLFDVFDGGAGFADVVAFMAERDFVLYDVVGGFCRASDRALYQLDIVFLPQNSEFR